MLVANVRNHMTGQKTNDEREKRSHVVFVLSPIGWEDSCFGLIGYIA